MTPLFGAAGPVAAGPLLLPIFAMTVVFFALNGSLQLLVVHLEGGASLARLFEDYLPHLALTFFTTLCASVLLVMNIENLTFAAVGVLIPILVLSYASSRLARDKRVTEAALRDSETRLRELSRHLSEVLWMIDLDRGTVLYVSPAYERIWGRTVASLHAGGDDWAAAIHDDDRQRVGDALAKLEPGDTFDLEYRVVRPDGRVRAVEHRGVAVEAPGGVGRRVVGVAQDITGRRRLELELVEARKMEGIGRLAGGIAHDFNNILTAILGYSDVVTAAAAPNSEVAIAGREIEAAADRGAALTRQLLALGRQQTLRSEVLDVNAMIRGLEYMLRRLIGADIAVEIALADDLDNIQADKLQLEQVLVNLVANARDAMPDGGTLTINTANVVRDRVDPQRTEMPAGDYVALTVADTGFGMDEETRARIFEPFFTRKPQGKGTGLGLATAYGTVKQLGGYIYVESAPGRGATFTIYLPRTTETAPLPARELAATPAAPPRGRETVLRVEDEAAVRSFVSMVLARAGYHLLEASTPREALTLEEGYGQSIDLLLIDVVMPEMHGQELATRIAARRTGVRVLYMSAYGADDAVDRGLVEVARGPLLEKPFGADALLTAVRQVIDGVPVGRIPAKIGAHRR